MSGSPHLTPSSPLLNLAWPLAIVAGLAVVSAAAAVVLGCAGEPPAPASEPEEPQGVSFEQFKATVYQEPRTGNFIVDGDTSIDEKAFSHERYSLTGFLRHELGHVLGFRHEHARPEAGTCSEKGTYRELTSYDPLSVMHYPWCNGEQKGDLTLSDLDKQGAALLYGAPGT